MRKLVIALVLAGAAMGIAAAVYASPTETPWYDPATCAVCKNMSSEPGLIEHMQMGSYATASGMVDVCTVDPKYMASYQKAKVGMMATIQKVMAGEKLPLDGCCASYGALAAAGAKIESFDTPTGSMCVVSSADPKVVEMIHAHAMRSNEEMKKMMEGKAAHEGHESGK